MPVGYELHSSDTVPELVQIMSKPYHPLERCWPAFVSETLTHYDLLYRVPYFSKYQFLVTHNGNPVAYSNAVPIYWPELEEHGQQEHGSKGWETITQCPFTLATIPPQGVRPDPVGKEPNTVCALGITIDAAHRKRGIADALLQNCKDLTQVYGYRAVVVPVRPTRKTEFLDAKMEDYVSWVKPVGAGTDEPFDPGVRTHVRLGGCIIKMCNESMLVDADIDTWERWTGVRFTTQESRYRKDEGGRKYWDMSIVGALTYIHYFPDIGRGLYIEPNVWIRHV
ncbi:hypothetical protein HOY82DRAFT_588529 [Tuber indicum]|nr:hypothetical protein HOY82DRAFT_588529 [Tuber indicum]